MTQMPGCWHIGQMNPGTDGRWDIRAVRTQVHRQVCVPSAGWSLSCGGSVV